MRDAFGVSKKWSPTKVAALQRAASRPTSYRFMTKKGKATLKAKTYAKAELGARGSQAPEFREAGGVLRSIARREVR